jgi:hypothetical protein
MKTFTTMLMLIVATGVHAAQMQYTGDGGGGSADVSVTCQADGSGRFSYNSTAGSRNDGTALLEGSGSGVIAVNKKTGVAYPKSSSGSWIQTDFAPSTLVWEGTFRSKAAGEPGETFCNLLQDEEYGGLYHVTGYSMIFEQCAPFKVTGEDANGNKFTDSGQTCIRIFGCNYVGFVNPDGSGEPVPCTGEGWGHTVWE